MLKHMKNGQWNQIWSRNSSRFENQVYNISPPFKEEKPGVSTRSRQEGGYTQLFLMWTEGKNSYRDVGRVMGNHRDGVGPPEPLEPQSWRAKGEKGLAELGEAAAWGEDPNQHALTPSGGGGGGNPKGSQLRELGAFPLLPSSPPLRHTQQEVWAGARAASHTEQEGGDQGEGGAETERTASHKTHGFCTHSSGETGHHFGENKN